MTQHDLEDAFENINRLLDRLDFLYSSMIDTLTENQVDDLLDRLETP